MNATTPDAEARLARLRAKRLAVDDRAVCLERARILQDAVRKHANVGHVLRQGLILQELCAGIGTPIDSDDLTAGRMPEAMPTDEEERFVAGHPELFDQPGVPGVLDSVSICVPDWSRLLRLGLGGLVREAEGYLAQIEGQGEEAQRRREFLESAILSLSAVSTLLRRYAAEARRQERQTMAVCCERAAWDAPTTFREALQLFRVTHMVLSCLVGARDVTPGRMDQYLYPLYREDVASGRMSPSETVELLAEVLLSLSQMAGHGTDFYDNRKRSPCKYTHLYVTVGGCDSEGRVAVNDLSYAILDAIRLLRYKEPTLLVRYAQGLPSAFRRRVGELVRERFPVTIYNDETVIRALVHHGVPLADARQYAFSACHNVLIPGKEAGSYPEFHNVPEYLLLATVGGGGLAAGRQDGEIDGFEKLWDGLRAQMAFALAQTRRRTEDRWRSLEPAAPMLWNCLMESAMREQRSCWAAASVSHGNQHLMGLGTTVDALMALRRLVFDERKLTLAEMADALRANWTGHESLRHRVRYGLPKFGQDDAETNGLARRLGAMWVEEVARANRGLQRLQMWPGFYSHVNHIFSGERTAATPDGRLASQPLSENQGPSFGVRGLSPTWTLRAMSHLPFACTPSGATSLTLPPADMAGDEGLDKLLALIETYFRLGGLHLQVNVVDATTLRAAMAEPEKHADLMVRVTGFSAYFVSLTRQVQDDLVARYERDGGQDC